MSSQETFLFSKGSDFQEFKVVFPIKQGRTAETYRIKDSSGKLFLLKLFNLSKVHRSAFSEDGSLLEISILLNADHSNIVKTVGFGEITISKNKYAYIIEDFIAGETLEEYLSRENFNSLYEIKEIICGVLRALDYLHNLDAPVIHNEITPQNIMLNLSDEEKYPVLIDFGYARFLSQPLKYYNREGLNLNYLANETFNGIFSPQTDIYSAGALLYRLIYDSPPWNKGISRYADDWDKAEDLVSEARGKTLQFPDVSEDYYDFDESIVRIIKKAIHPDTETRFQTAQEFLLAINGEIDVEDVDLHQKITSTPKQECKVKTQKLKGKGFDAIAGMEQLKAQLKLDVIDALKKPDEYLKYGLTIPNGMLLYGPPGCGKTFFAKHFAEEVGFNFMMITPSSLKSRFVNATQENIAKMFSDAEKDAPTIIFIDELNELVPNRDSDAHEMAKSAVNEMLAQMDRTGEKGIFIIGATNYPNKIDPAVLRAGRLDKKFYLPPPDKEARKAMFTMYLKSRPLDFGIDYDKLAQLTENFVSADIEFLVNESARQALKMKSKITMSILVSTIAASNPSVSLKELEKYESIRSEMEAEAKNTQQKNERRKIGF